MHERMLKAGAAERTEVVGFEGEAVFESDMKAKGTRLKTHYIYKCAPSPICYEYPPCPSSLMPFLTSASVLPIVLLVASNVFMTVAWYGHLRFKGVALPIVIAVSWGIALFEYCLAVPANRIGSEVYSAAQLKTIQEVITLVVFAGFSVVVLKEPLGWNHAAGFALIAAGAFLIFQVK